MQICIKECPTENFAFAVDDKSDLRNKMICKDGVSVSTPDEAEKMIANNTCAGYYLKSSPGEGSTL
jgi:hypothetical protein